jgi:hypothetical protein
MRTLDEFQVRLGIRCPKMPKGEAAAIILLFSVK